MTEPTTTPQALLERAADLLDEYGWHQGGYAGPGGCLCALGAIYKAAYGAVPGPGGPAGDSRGLVRAAEDLAEAQIRPDWRPLSLWNDEPGRTKAEVQALLRAAAGGAR